MPLSRFAVLLTLVFTAAALTVALGLWVADLSGPVPSVALGLALVAGLALRALAGTGRHDP